MPTACYLDIETTGLSHRNSVPSVVGLRAGSRFFQWHGDQIRRELILDALPGDAVIYTYNGHRFDLPFLDHHLQIGFRSKYKTIDLMFECWKFGLKGGLKAVERTLGIAREDTETDGYLAVVLWHRWERHGDEEALQRLLDYNREDVETLPHLHRKLQEKSRGISTFAWSRSNPTP
jgi:uncharacterized protein YprB with RNaseH-like and TPR domain